MEVGPEGALYVLDWHDADICGEAVLDKDTGRIFRITPTGSHADDWNGRYSNLAEMSDVRLAEMQTSESSWHSRRARVILQHRATNGSIDSDAEAALNELFDAHPNSDYRLRGMWALHVTGLLTNDRLLVALEDDDEYVRAWAVQLLLDNKHPGARALDTFARMARSDGSAVVRKYLAGGLQRMEEQDRWEIAEGLLGRGEDADDHNIPKLIWFGVEPLVAEETNRALALAAASEIPLVTEFIARRVVDADAMESLTAALGQYGEARVEMLQGMRAGLEGRTELSPPAGWASVYEILREDEDAAPIAIEVAQYFGDDAAAGQLLERLMDDAAPMDQRKRALNGLASQRREELIPELPILLDKAELRVESIRAVAAFDHDPLGVMLLEKYAEFDRKERREALRALASRPSYGWMLTEALKSGDIPKREVPADIARQLRRVVGSGFVEVWGPIDEDPSDDSEAYAQYRALLTPEAVDGASPSRGRQVFERTCGACHMMYGEGGAVGPDLTGSNRTDLDYILTNVLEPSAVIQDDYKMVVITTRDGRTVIGNVASETDRQVTLRVVGRDEVVLNTSEIQSRELSANSLMPEGLFRTLSDEEVLDLVSYLHTAEQVPASDE
jgi:putative heme-binding domain-containing protein